MWAVVPIKDFTNAKERLSQILSPQERRSLARAMAEDVLRSLLGVSELEGIAVVTRDAEAQALCEELGIRVLIEAENQGQTSAVMAASRTLKDEDVESVLTIPGDVPLVLPQDIRSVLAAHGGSPAMTIVPARDYQGSNCVTPFTAWMRDLEVRGQQLLSAPRCRASDGYRTVNGGVGKPRPRYRYTGRS